MFFADSDNITNPATITWRQKQSLILRGHGFDYLPINNPQRGIAIIGAAGSGKSRYVIEPLIYELVKKGDVGIIYDYAFPALTQVAYNAHLRFPDTKGKRKFQILNFHDLERSVRFNPLAPELFAKDQAYLNNIIGVFLENLMPGAKRDFWRMSAECLFIGVFVFLKNKYPAFCDLPHALLLVNLPVEKLIALLQTDAEAGQKVVSVAEALSAKAETQVAGVTAYLRTQLDPLMNQEVFWVLSGNDFSPQLNSLDTPTIVCFGNDPSKQRVLAPIFSVLISGLFSQLYRIGQTQSFVILDELPQLILPGLADVPATARKYGVSTIVAFQEKAQLEAENRYGHARALELINAFSTVFGGNSNFNTAKFLSELMGKKDKITTRSRGAGGSSESVSEGDLKFKPQDFFEFEIGEFAGKCCETDSSAFRMQFKAVEELDVRFKSNNLKPLPVFYKAVNVEANKKKIEADIEEMLKKSIPNIEKKYEVEENKFSYKTMVN